VSVKEGDGPDVIDMGNMFDFFGESNGDSSGEGARGVAVAEEVVEYTEENRCNEGGEVMEKVGCYAIGPWSFVCFKASKRHQDFREGYV